MGRRGPEVVSTGEDERDAMKNKLIFFLVGILIGIGIMYFAQSRQKYSSLELCRYYSTKDHNGMAVYVVAPPDAYPELYEKNIAWRLVQKKYPGKFDAVTVMAKTEPETGWCELIVMSSCYRKNNISRQAAKDAKKTKN